MRMVVKFGGSSLKNLARLRLAARNLAALRAAGHEVLAVVSAMGDSTNRLVRMGRRVHPEGPVDQHYLRLLATGENTSAQVLAMALAAEGCRAQAISFDHPDFPLVAAPGQAESQVLSSGKVNDLVEVRLDEEACEDRFARLVAPLLQARVIPVLPGFFVRDGDFHLVTLGRGGSDVSAFLAGRFARADEVVIVTDVEGVLTADPRLVRDASVVAEMDAALMSAVAQRGAQVLHPNALRYKPESTAARVVHFRALGRMAEGTRIVGAARPQLARPPSPLPLGLLFGEGISRRLGLLARLGEFAAKRGVAIHASTSSDSIVGIYVEQDHGGGIAEDLHREFVGPGRDFQEMVVTRDVAEVRLSNPAFISTHGVIRVIADTLYQGGLNIVEIVTSHADIHVYCQWNQAETVRRLLSDRLGIEARNGHRNGAAPRRPSGRE